MSQTPAQPDLVSIIKSVLSVLKVEPQSTDVIQSILDSTIGSKDLTPKLEITDNLPNPMDVVPMSKQDVNMYNINKATEVKEDSFVPSGILKKPAAATKDALGSSKVLWKKKSNKNMKADKISVPLETIKEEKEIDFQIKGPSGMDLTPAKPQKKFSEAETLMKIVSKRRRCTAPPEFIRSLHVTKFQCFVKCGVCDAELHEGNVLDHIENTGHDICCGCHNLNEKASASEIGSFLTHLHIHHRIIHE
jgi:hypothetical protein